MKANKLAELLRDKREKSGLSQKAVATKLGYSTPQFISNWERGVSSPPLKVLKKLGNLYKINSDELFSATLEDTICQVTRDLKKKFYGKKAS